MFVRIPKLDKEIQKRISKVGSLNLFCGCCAIQRSEMLTSEEVSD
jgi:hypothetical protein